MLKMRVHGAIPFGVTSFQVAPPSVVTWITPSSVPAHSTCTDGGEGASAVIAPRGDAVTLCAYRPAEGGTAQVCRARSPLVRVQLWPRSSDFHTAFEA